MKIGRHFDLVEFCTSQTATRKGIDMHPSVQVVSNLRDLVQYVLDPLRDALGQPAVISSGYRPPALNKAVGGSPTSQHVFGQAADIIFPGLPPRLVCEAVLDLRLPFDQLIHEFGRWTHVSYTRANRRGQVLTATMKWKSKVVYTEGLPERTA